MRGYFQPKKTINGFAGLAPFFVIGEQPSLSTWPRHNKGRRSLYDLLLACGAGPAHLTDIVKTRAKGHAWRDWPPECLQPHFDLLRRELDELKPEKLILLGNDTKQLFSAHFAKEAASARLVPHFGCLQWVPQKDRGGGANLFVNSN